MRAAYDARDGATVALRAMPADGARLTGRPWWALVVGASVLTLAATALSQNPQLGAGLAIFFVLLLLPLRAPIEAVFLLLATGWIPFERWLGWEKTLLPFVGGFNVSGLRLVGAIGGLSIAVLLYRDRFMRLNWPTWVLPGLVLYGGLIAWSALTVVWTPNKVDGLRAVAKLAFPLLIAAVVLADPRDWGPRRMTARLFWLLAGTLLFATLFGFTQILPADEPGRIGEIWGWAGRASYAFFAAIVGILALALLENRALRGAGWVALLALIQLPYTVSRIAIAACGVALTWMVLTTGVRRWLAPVGVAAAAALFIVFSPVVDRNVADAPVSTKPKLTSARMTALAPGRPVNVTVVGGQGWSEKDARVIAWDVPPGETSIRAWHSEMCKLETGICQTKRVAQINPTADYNAVAFDGRGDYRIRYWLENAAGHASPANASRPVHLRYTGGPGMAAPERANGGAGFLSKLVAWVPDHIRLEGRDQLWSSAIGQMTPADYVFGAGLNAWWAHSVATYNDGSQAQLHGEYVRLLYETGAVGLILFIAAMILLTAGLIRLAAAASPYTLGRATAAAGVGVLAVYALTAATDNTLDYYLVGGYVWAIVGLAVLTAQRPVRD